MTIPTDLRAAPEAVRCLGAALGTAEKDQYERLVVMGSREPVLVVSIAAHRRALLLLAALSAALEARGHSLVLRDAGSANSLSIVLGDDELRVSLTERLDQREHVLTDDEQRRVATGYTYGIPKHDQFAGGRLQLALPDSRGTRTSWSDTATRRLDRQLGTVVLAAEREAQLRQKQRELEVARCEEEARRRAAEEEAREKQRLNEARAKYRQHLEGDLRQMASTWSEADEIRRFLGAVRAASPATTRDEPTTVWLKWADAHVLTLDPLTTPHKVAKVVEPSDEQLSRRG